MGWGQFAFAIIMLIASYALRPKQPPPQAATIDEIKIPTSSSSDPVPIVFGSRKVTPNVLWYGDLRTSAIKEKSK